MPDKDCAEVVLSVFDRIYVLNLPHRRDRRREMEAELARIGLSFAHPSVTLFPAIAPADPGEFQAWARGAVSKAIWRCTAPFWPRGPDGRWILEDDASFARGFAERFADAPATLLRKPTGICCIRCSRSRPSRATGRWAMGCCAFRRNTAF